MEWSKKWQLPFNLDKCKRFHTGANNTLHEYTMGGNILEQVKEEKDLGVLIDAELKFHKQTAAAVKKANSVLGLIKRSFINLDEELLPILYKSLVRPHLEYGNVIWGLLYKDHKSIERVQRRATKLVHNLRNLPSEERLRKLKIPSLEHRRRRRRYDYRIQTVYRKYEYR